jgi:hypothetical protein
MVDDEVRTINTSSVRCPTRVPTNAGEAFVSVREPVKVWAAMLKRIETQ